MADDVPDGYGNVRVSFSGSRNVTQGDKDAATIRVFFNDREIEKKNGIFDGRLPTGTRLAITAEAVSGGKIIGKGEETITVKSGTNDVSMKIYTWDNFVVTIDGKATGYTNFMDAWDSASGKTATLKMNADAKLTTQSTSNSRVASLHVSGGNITLDLNGHTLEGNGSAGIISINGGTFTMKDSSSVGKITGGGGGGGIYVGAGAAFVMNGGAITGNAAFGTNGGGVSVNGTFTMNGGIISANTGVINTTSSSMTGGYGAGVYVDGGGTFNWYDGTISGNTATGSGNNVYVSQGATYTRNGVPQDTSQDVIID